MFTTPIIDTNVNKVGEEKVVVQDRLIHLNKWKADKMR